LKLVSAAGVAPGACARPPPSVPSRVRWLLRYALMLRAVFKNAGVEIRDAETLGISLAVSCEIGGPEGTCSRRCLHPIREMVNPHSARAEAPPLIELRIRNGGQCWQRCFRTGNYSQCYGGPAHAVVAGVGVAPTEAELMRLA